MFVCHCAVVTDTEIRACVRDGARTAEDVGDRCAAGTGCGGCLDQIDTIIATTPCEARWSVLSRSA